MCGFFGPHVRTEFRWVEALCLASVILATTWVELSFKEETESLDPVTSLDGYIQLSTRSSMDSLNLNGFDVGATATFNLEITTTQKDKCDGCNNQLDGKRITGTVNITELFDEQGRSGRIEAEITVDHIEERDSNGFLLQEWFVLDWNAGASSFDQIIHVVHSSKPWSNLQGSGSFLIATSSGHESRTGPSLITEQIIENHELVRACLPDSFTCNGVSNWDIEMNVYRGISEDSYIIDVPSNYSEISVPTNLTSSDSGLLGSWVNLSESDVPIVTTCIHEPGSINTAGSWKIDGSTSGIISPLSSVLASAGLPVLQVQMRTGILTVMEGELGTCSHYIADNSTSQIFVFEN